MKTLIISLLVLVMVIAVLLLKSPIFVVRNQTYKISQADCITAEDLERDANLSGSNIFLVNTSKVEKALKAKYPCVGFVTSQKSFPSTLNIEVSGRQPKLVLIPYTLEATPSTASSVIEEVDPKGIDPTKLNDKYLVDDQDQIYAQGNVPGLPNVILLDQEVSLGKSLGSGVAENILTILQRVKGLSLNVDWIFLSGDSLLIEDQNPSKVYFSLNSDILTELASLQLILQKSTIDSKSMDSVDLRFDKPVVIYSAKK